MSDDSWDNDPEVDAVIAEMFFSPTDEEIEEMYREYCDGPSFLEECRERRMR